MTRAGQVGRQGCRLCTRQGTESTGGASDGGEGQYWPSACALECFTVPVVLRAASRSCRHPETGLMERLRWCTALCFTSCSRHKQVRAALSQHQLLSLSMQEELAERRRHESKQRQRLMHKSQGKEQGALPSTLDAGKQPFDEERNVSSTLNLLNLGGR